MEAGGSNAIFKFRTTSHAGPLLEGDRRLCYDNFRDKMVELIGPAREAQEVSRPVSQSGTVKIAAASVRIDSSSPGHVQHGRIWFDQGPLNKSRII